MLGIAGAHRTGKSTLAKIFSEQTGIPYVEASATPTFVRLGCDPKADYTLDTRIAIQFATLADLALRYQEAPKVFVTDRTPLDLMAYMLADVQRRNIDERENGMVMEYLAKCIAVSKRHLKAYLILQPGIPLKEEEGKAPANPSYMEHINSLVVGLGITRLADDTTTCIVAQRSTLSIPDRLEVLTRIAVRAPLGLVNSPSDQRALA